MSGVEMDANNLPLHERLSNLIRNLVPVFQSSEGLAKQLGAWQEMCLFEELIVARAAVNAVACEGHERVFRSQSRRRYVYCILLYG